MVSAVHSQCGERKTICHGGENGRRIGNIPRSESPKAGGGWGAEKREWSGLRMWVIGTTARKARQVSA